jgi:hypothetical protein
MSLAGKVYKNNITGDLIKVIDSFENIAILENKQKIDVTRLMDSNQYTEQIDPSSFFNNQGAYNILAEKIKTIPSHLIQDDGEINVNPTTTINIDGFGSVSNESAIVMTTEDDEKAELARKYGVNPDPVQAVSKQNEAFAKILGEESAEELPNIPVRTFEQNEVVQKVEVDRGFNQPVVQKVEVEDPIITMFKRTKRNVEFKISVDISDKIPRLDFIEMMEDSYEISMIDFLADEFTNKILQDPSSIKESIKDKIKHLVYGGEFMKKEPNVNPQITDSVTEVNSQITDAVTQVNQSKVIETEPRMVNEAGKKTTTTRKPRVKKESTEK